MFLPELHFEHYKKTFSKVRTIPTSQDSVVISCVTLLCAVVTGV